MLVKQVVNPAFILWSNEDDSCWKALFLYLSLMHVSGLCGSPVFEKLAYYAKLLFIFIKLLCLNHLILLRTKKSTNSMFSTVLVIALARLTLGYPFSR